MGTGSPGQRSGRLLVAVLALAGAGALAAAGRPAQEVSDGPVLHGRGAETRLEFPGRYREWIYLTSGMDMNYGAKAMAMGHSVFDNVFVNPGSYRAFLKTGAWPEGTAFVLENRGAVSGASINTQGLTQSAKLMGFEVHVKDASLPGGWGFFSFDSDAPAKLTPRPATCYSCHEQHAAVDTTFVQFYPTILQVAKEKGTLSAAYLQEEAGRK